MKKTLKNTPVINNDIVNPVSTDVDKPNFIITISLKLLRWILNRIIKIITLLSNKSTTSFKLASLFAPIIKYLGILLSVAKYFKMFEFFHYFRLILKLIASFNLLLAIIVLFSFSDYNLEFISSIWLISPALSYFYDLNYFSESVEWTKLFIKKIFRALLETILDYTQDTEIKVSDKTLNTHNNIDGYHYSDKKPYFSIYNFLLLFLVSIFFGGIYYNWNDQNYVFS